jgi:hypothetical protein
MASYKAWYILALGVLALGIINSSLHRGGNWLQAAGAMAQQVSSHTSTQLAMAKVALLGCPAKHSAAPPVMFVDAQFAPAVEVAMARHRVEMVRLQANFARMQAERARALALAQVRVLRDNAVR